MCQKLVAPILALFLPALAMASDCSVTSVGFSPLNDLGPGFHLGERGGLYPEGRNKRPPGHDAAGLAIGNGIVPLDALGNPDPSGLVGLISVGMSNTTQEFQRFLELARNDDDLASHLRLIDGAQGGQDARRMADPSSDYWTTWIPEALRRGDATAEQIQAVWLKQGVAGADLPFPHDALEFQGFLEIIVGILKDVFPNLKVCYLSSRIYAGYADTALNPEPHAYQSGFGVKWLIRDQIAGKPSLNYDPDRGPVEAPWLSWGPYLWADGLIPRSDGLIWRCSDLRDDGTHPSGTGTLKVATRLLHFFKSDLSSVPWFLESGAGTCGGPAFVELYGSGTDGVTGVPRISTTTLPTIPSDEPFGLHIENANPLSPGAYLMGLIRLEDGEVPWLGGWLHTVPRVVHPRPTNAQGVANLIFGPIPEDPTLCGVISRWQYVVVDPDGPSGMAISPGLDVRTGS